MSGKIMETARASVVPKSFWAIKYAVSPIICPNIKLMNRIIHNSHGRKNILKITLNITEIMKNVSVPIAVRTKLMNIGLASGSTLLNITFDTTNVKTAKIAINSPAIKIIVIHEIYFFRKKLKITKNLRDYPDVLVSDHIQKV
jgi:hypothetical protein